MEPALGQRAPGTVLHMSEGGSGTRLPGAESTTWQGGKELAQACGALHGAAQVSPEGRGIFHEQREHVKSPSMWNRGWLYGQGPCSPPSQPPQRAPAGRADWVRPMSI